MDTSGFYKVDGSGELLYAPNFVHAPNFSLIRKKKDIYIYPQDGWKWFDSEELTKSEYKIDTRVSDIEKIIDECPSISTEDRLKIKEGVANLRVTNLQPIGVKENA